MADTENDYLLVMTACIDVSHSGAALFRRDTGLRLRDYEDSLKFWLAYDDPRIRKILFIDNSGHSFDSLRKIEREFNVFGKEVEFIQTNDNSVPENIHYGYAELGLLDYAHAHSELARGCKWLIKTTGRLTFPGLSRLLDRLPAEFDFAVDARNNTWFVKRPEVFVTTQLMIFSRSFYANKLLGIKSQLTPGMAMIEDLLYQILVPHKGNPKAVLRWPINVNPVGYAAHWNKDYGSPRQRLINLARAGCRILLPNWWV